MTDTEDDQRCPECGFLACICFDDDDQPAEDEGFDCPAWKDASGWHCPLIGSEECDWDCQHSH